MISQQILQSAALYERDPENVAILTQLLQGRRKLAQELSGLSDAGLEQIVVADMGRARQALLALGIGMEKPGGIGEDDDKPGATEAAFVEDLKLRMTAGWSAPHAPQHFLALSLYVYAHEFPRAFDLPRVPAWLVPDYVSYMLAPPPLFRAVGEADAYLAFMREWSAYLADGAAANPGAETWQQALVVFAQRANVIPLYFNDQNVKDVFSTRADLMERALRHLGHALDYAPPERASGEGSIRIGIMAAAFGPTAETAASLPLYEHLSRLGGGFEVTLYCLHSSNHPMEQYCRSRAKALKVLPRQDLKMQVDFLRAERIDILFFATNVAAVTNQFALLATHRLARVQATSIFSIVTTGFRNMDFYISGTTTDPSPAAQEHYRERLIKMEGSVHCFSYPVTVPSTVRMQREHANIDPAAIVFASQANLYKLRPELLHAWARIMARVPDSILLLFPYGPHWTKSYPKRGFMDLITRICAEHGIGAEWLRILDQTPAPSREDIREILRLADVYLDSFPFCGSTSLIEPLEIGLPPVVKAGEQLRSSMAAAMMNELQMPELIGSDVDSYVDLAVALATDREKRAGVREQIRDRMSRTPRFLDSELYARRIAKYFELMLVEAGKPK